MVTGVGRTGDWFAADRLPCTPDMIALAKGLGAGYTAIGAVLFAGHVYEAAASGAVSFSIGHTWDGAPLPCAVGLAVLDVLEKEGWVDHVAARGPSLREDLEAALEGDELVGEVRGRGYLIGVDYADPEDGVSFLPPELGAAGADRAGGRPPRSADPGHPAPPATATPATSTCSRLPSPPRRRTWRRWWSVWRRRWGRSPPR